MSVEIGLCGVDKWIITNAYFECNYWNEAHEHYQSEHVLQKLCKSLGVFCYDTFKKDISNMEALYHNKVSECIKEWNKEHSPKTWQRLFASSVSDWPQWMLRWENNYNQLADNAKQWKAQLQQSGDCDISGSSSSSPSPSPPSSSSSSDSEHEYNNRRNKSQNKPPKYNFRSVKAQQLLYRVEVVTCCGDVWRMPEDDCKYLDQLLLHCGEGLTVLTKRCIDSVLCKLSIRVLLRLIRMMTRTTFTGPHWNTLRKLYTQRGRYCPALLMQRRWYEIWRMIKQNKRSNRNFIRSLTNEFPFLLECNMKSWSEMIRNKQLYTDTELDNMMEVDIELFMPIAEFGAEHLELDCSDNIVTSTLIFDDSDEEDNSTKQAMNNDDKRTEITAGDASATTQAAHDDSQREKLSLAPVVMLERLNVTEEAGAAKGVKRVCLPDMCDAKRLHNMAGVNIAQISPIPTSEGHPQALVLIDNKRAAAGGRKTKAGLKSDRIWCCLAHKHAYYCCLRTIFSNRKGKPYVWPSHRHPPHKECDCCCTHLLHGQHILQIHTRLSNKRKQPTTPATATPATPAAPAAKRKATKPASVPPTPPAEVSVAAVSDKDRELNEWLMERQYASKMYGIKARPLNTVSYTDFVKNKINPPIIIHDTSDKETITDPFAPDPNTLSGYQIPNIRSFTITPKPTLHTKEPVDPNTIMGHDVPKLSSFMITTPVTPGAVQADANHVTAMSSGSELRDALLRPRVKLIRRCPMIPKGQFVVERIKPFTTTVNASDDIDVDNTGNAGNAGSTGCAGGVRNTLSIVSIRSIGSPGGVGSAGDFVNISGVGNKSNNISIRRIANNGGSAGSAGSAGSIGVALGVDTVGNIISVHGIANTSIVGSADDRVPHITVDDYLRDRPCMSLRVLREDRAVSSYRVCAHIRVLTSMHCAFSVPAYFSLDEGRRPQQILFGNEAQVVRLDSDSDDDGVLPQMHDGRSSPHLVCAPGVTHIELKKNPPVFGVVYSCARYLSEITQALSHGEHSIYLYDENSYRLVDVRMQQSPDTCQVTLAARCSEYDRVVQLLTEQLKRCKISQMEESEGKHVMTISSDDGSSGDELVYSYIAQNNGTSL